MDSNRLFITHSAAFLQDEFLPRIRIALEHLSDEQVWWRPNEASNSIGNLMLHLSGNVMQWIVGGIGKQNVKRDRDREFSERTPLPKAELLDRLAQTVQRAVTVLRSLEPAALGEQRTIQGNEVTVMYALYHVVEHFSMHTGQILLLTKMMTAKDLKLYEFPGGAARPRW